MYLDRTQSKVGQQYLYNQLRSITKKDELLAEKEALIQKFTTDEALRFILSPIIYFCKPFLICDQYDLSLLE